MKNIFLYKLFAMALAALTLTGMGRAAEIRRPNIVFVLADQWRAQATGYAGDPNVKTPYLDRLAAQGINFVNAVSCCPVCTPYRATLMTGQYPTTHGLFINDLHLADSAVTMGKLFSTAGYDTAYIGKWHLNGNGREKYISSVHRQGFKYWKVLECTHDYNHSKYFDGDDPTPRYWQGYDAIAQTKDAQQYIRDHANSDRPFLMVLAWGPPHYPFSGAPIRYTKMYQRDKIILPNNIPSRLRADAQAKACGYYAHCTALDDCMGELLKTLDDTKLADNTIIVFTSDHGEMLGSHDIKPSQKQAYWDESIRIPFLLRCPVVRSRKLTLPLNTPDILPTLLSLSGIEIPKLIEGTDYSALVHGGQEPSDAAALIMSVSPFDVYAKSPEYRGIRTARYSYVRRLDGPWLLFDNQTDPLQQTNLINAAAYSSLQHQRNAQLADKLKVIHDDFRPREFYIKKWNYNDSLGPNGAVR